MISKMEVECPECGEKQAAMRWDTLNVTLNPEGRLKLQDGLINTLVCSSCGHKSRLNVPLLYHDMIIGFLVKYYPFGFIGDQSFLDRFPKTGKLIPSSDLKDFGLEGSDYVEDEVHLVFTMGELVRYVMFREGLYGIDRSLSKHGMEWLNWFEKGVLLNKKGRYKDALHAFEKASLLRPDHALTWYNKATQHWKIESYEEAVKAFEKAIELEPRYEDAWYGLGMSLWDRGNNEEALEAFSRLVEINPKSARGWWMKAVTVGDAEDVEEAIACYKKTVELDPEMHAAYYDLACYQAVLNDFKGMKKSLEKAIGLNPRSEEHTSELQSH